MKQFGKILKFELWGYLKNKLFIGLTVFLVAAIAVAMFLPNIISSIKKDEPSEETVKPVMLISSEDTSLTVFMAQYFENAFTNYKVLAVDRSDEEVKKLITDKKATCAIAVNKDFSFTYYVNNLSMYDTNAAQATAVLQEVYRANAMIVSGLSPDEVKDIMSVQIESRTETLGKNQLDNFFYTYLMIFALYMVILLYGQMVATNVATEKSSRAMEVLITSANPTNLMFGKILASCIAGLSQLLLIFGSAIVFYNINKENLSNPIIQSIFAIPIDLFIFMLIFFVLGFLIYAFMFGAIGSTASKLEDINTSVMPVTFLFIIAFIVVVTSMSSGSVDNMAMKVCSYIPFTSPMAMFTRIAMSTVAWYEIAISIFILAGSVIGVGIISAKIYRVGVLMYGTKPKISNILKNMFLAK